MTPPPYREKYAPLLKQIEEAEACQKPVFSAILLAMLTCDFAILVQDFNRLKNRVYLVGLAIAAMIFLGINAKTMLELIFKLVK